MALSSDSNSLLDISAIQHLPNGRVAIVYTEWNDKIVAEQIAGAERIAAQTGNTISHKIQVPGSFELPFEGKALYEATAHKADAPQAIIVFGSVIRGGTPHFGYVCKAVTEGVLKLNLSLTIPTVFVAMTLDYEQRARKRLSGGKWNHG